MNVYVFNISNQINHSFSNLILKIAKHSVWDDALWSWFNHLIPTIGKQSAKHVVNEAVHDAKCHTGATECWTWSVREAAGDAAAMDWEWEKVKGVVLFFLLLPGSTKSCSEKKNMTASWIVWTTNNPHQQSARYNSTFQIWNQEQTETGCMIMNEFDWKCNE